MEKRENSFVWKLENKIYLEKEKEFYVLFHYNPKPFQAEYTSIAISVRKVSQRQGVLGAWKVSLCFFQMCHNTELMVAF